MKKIKELIAISFLFVITGCEDTVNFTKPSDNKKYFVCIDYEFDPNVESVLYVDTIKREIEIARLRWTYYSEDEQEIYSVNEGDNYEDHIKFNFITGKANITRYNFREDGKNKVTSWDYQCRKTDSML